MRRSPPPRQTPREARYNSDMKPLYIFLLMWAIGITGFADGITWAFAWLPGLGWLLSITIVFCINITFGSGLLFLLITNGMFHPRLGPVGVVFGVVPPFNFLPIWLGLVLAGIAHDMSKEKGALGEIAKLADTLQQTKNPLTRARAIMSASKDMSRLTQGRPPQPANDNEPQGNEEKEKSRSPLDLKSPGMPSNVVARNMHNDIVPASPPAYAKAA